MKVLTIFGTRPEAIKLAPVICELQRHSPAPPPAAGKTGVSPPSPPELGGTEGGHPSPPELGGTEGGPLRSLVCVTAQHRQMLDQVLDLFHIVPDIDLDLMQAGQTPSQVAARVLTELEPVLQAERPDWVLVQGDTTTVMATAIAAHHLRIKVGHVEAGLRTHDRFNPFPEEMNRVIADHLSDLHFAPTECARQNLLREGIPDARIHVTGNTVIDALLDVASRPCPPEVKALLNHPSACRRSRIADRGSQIADRRLQIADRRLHIAIRSTQYAVRNILVTAHRRESFGVPLQRICAALRELVRRHDDVRVVYPVHLNPSVWGPVHELLGDVPRIRLLPPVDYLTLVHLMKHSTLILTDSGGIQEEAPSLGVPVLVLREVTERPEAVEAGAARVVGTNPERILADTEHLLDNPAAHAAMSRTVNPYGDGHAAERIIDVLLDGHCQTFAPGPAEVEGKVTRKDRDKLTG